MKLSTRLTVATIALVLGTSAAVTLFGYYNAERAVVPVALERVRTQAQARALALEADVQSVRNDALSLRMVRAYDGIVRAKLNGGVDPEDNISEARWRERLEVFYAGQLRAKPAFIQLSFIGVADGGREILRVERSGPEHSVRAVETDELQRQGDHDFFKEAVRLPPDAAHVSIELRQERERIVTPHVPVLRFAMPVRAGDGAPFGVVTVSLDMRPLLAGMRASMGEGSMAYLVDALGDYLMHPDPNREFAFATGQRLRWQDDFPDLAAALGSDTSAVAIVPDANGARVVAGVKMLPLAGGPRVGVIETVSYSSIMAPAAVAGKSGLLAGLAAVLCALALAVPLGHSLTRPLVQMTDAVKRFAHGGPMQVPLHAGGEVGVLAEAFANMATQVTQKTEAERRNSEILDKIIASMADAVLLVDAQGQTLFANPTCKALFGDRPDIGSPEWQRTYHRFRTDGVTPLPPGESPIGRAMNGENFDNIELVFRRDGETHGTNIIASGRTIIGTSGKQEGAVIVYRNVTALKETERQLRQAQKMEAVGQLTGGVAHDFNNMLTVITGTIEILAEGVADRPELAVLTQMMDDAVIRATDLTHQLLAFSRKQPLQPRKTDINALVLDAAKLLRSTLGQQIEIVSTIDQTASPALVDPSQLTSALLNLAVNARDAMANRGKLTIETRNTVLDETYARQHNEVTAGPYVMVAVSDTGSGIPAAIRDRVFDPFFTTKEPGKGTGLGLSMVYGFVKQSGGHIKIYSEEGHGTSVKIYLPRADATGVDIVAPSTQEIEVGQETIMVVEDDELVRSYVITHLASLGYVVLAAANAHEALELVAEGKRFDLLFTDVIMAGGMNGRELADEMVRLRPRVKVLFTSGYTENAIMHHGRLDPGVLLLAKPYRKAELARMVRQALDAPAPAAVA